MNTDVANNDSFQRALGEALIAAGKLDKSGLERAARLANGHGENIANILAKLARGVADDLLSTFYTAVTAPVVVAPAMNTRMWQHPATQANLGVLRGRGVTIVDPDSGWLAEGETGEGRMAGPGEIVERTLEAARRSNQLSGKKIVVTAGPTREPLDPVRFISNRSSGKIVIIKSVFALENQEVAD